jgi:hypothetical protein
MIAQDSEELLWNQIVARAWCDDQLMQRLLANPREVLAEQGLQVQSGAAVEVMLGKEVKIDETESVRRFVLSARPSEELMEEDLTGDRPGPSWWCASGACRCGACGCRCRCFC